SFAPGLARRLGEMIHGTNAEPRGLRLRRLPPRPAIGQPTRSAGLASLHVRRDLCDALRRLGSSDSTGYAGTCRLHDASDRSSALPDARRSLRANVLARGIVVREEPS